MNRRKNGNVMIETVISVSIILSMFIIVMNLIVSNKKSVAIRKEMEEGNRIVYCIMQEIKYNMNFQELIYTFQNGVLSYENSKDLLNNLRVNDLSCLPKGDDILVEGEQVEDDIVVSIILKNEYGEVLIKREFIKSKWMDYYYET